MTITQFLADHGITAASEWADDNPNMTDMPRGSSHWRVTFARGRKRMTVPFSMCPAHSSEPDAPGVFDCLLSDATGADQSFEEWCGYYGYDSDSRKAERTYKAVTRQTAKLRQFLGADLFSAALDCERE
jgi:hypothetical protein